MSRGARIRRFTRTERAAHWLLAGALLTMFVSGTQMPGRWSVSEPVFDIHVGAAAVLLCGLALLWLCANRVALRVTAVDLATLEDRDRDWLRRLPARLAYHAPLPPAGRFNGGQKVNARLALAGLTALYATGLMLLAAGRGGPQGPLHALATAAMVGLVSGHVFMAVLNPATRHALRGMVSGEVDREWAEHHHPAWVDGLDRDAGG